MSEQTAPELDVLLADPPSAAEVSTEAIPALLVQLAAEHGRLNAVERVLLARLVADTSGNGSDGDRLLTVEEAAPLLGTSVDWLKRHAHELPFTVTLSPGQVRYSSAAIQRFIKTRLGS